MAGIFPNGGVPAGQAQNTVTTPVAEGCETRFHSTSRCTPRFDPAAANAMMSEILNTINCAENEYDCNRLDNLCLAVRKLFELQMLQGCYQLQDIGSNCNVERVAFANTGDGCGRIVRVTENPLPVGFQTITDRVFGTHVTVITGAPEDRSSRLEQAYQTRDTTHMYEILVNPAFVSLSVDEFCGLNTAGTPLRFSFSANAGYYVVAAAPTPRIIGPYQYGAALFVDGAFVQGNPDWFGLNTSGHNSFVEDTQGATITTTGATMTVEIVPFLVVDTTLPAYRVNDELHVDMAQISARYEQFI